MLTAMVAHPPRFGGKVKSFDATRRAARSRAWSTCSQIPTGVAVVANDTWAARKGRDALKVDLGRRQGREARLRRDPGRLPGHRPPATAEAT